MTNLNTAFDVAEKYLDIPKMLDAEGEENKEMMMMMIKRGTNFFPGVQRPKYFPLRNLKVT